MNKILTTLCIVLVAALSSCTSDKHNANAATTEAVKTKKATSKKKAQQTANLPVILDFYADWCGPCRQFKPVFEDAKKRYNGKIFFKSVDVDREEAMAQQFGIQYLPTVVFLDSQGKEITRHTGYMDKDMFDQYIGKLIKK